MSRAEIQNPNPTHAVGLWGCCLTWRKGFEQNADTSFYSMNHNRKHVRGHRALKIILSLIVWIEINLVAFKCTATADKTSSKNLREGWRKIFFLFPFFGPNVLLIILTDINIEKWAKRSLRDDLSLYPKARFARSEPFLMTVESVAPWLIYSSSHLSFLLGNVSNAWPISSLLQFKPIVSCLIPSGRGEQFITFLSATTFYIVEGCYHVSPSVFSSLD